MVDVTYGLTKQGFAAKPLSIIKADLDSDFRHTFGSDINLQPESVFGQLSGIFADRLADLWALAQAVYDAGDPESASDEDLVVAASYTGTIRKPATHSRVWAVVRGDKDTLLSAKTTCASMGEGRPWFSLLEDVTLSEEVEIDDPNDTGSPRKKIKTYQAMGLFEAQDVGPIRCDANLLIRRESNIRGWDSITNPQAADIGRLIETDAAFRRRREAEIQLGGSSPVDAIRAEILTIKDVHGVQVIEDIYNHTIEALVSVSATASPDINQAICDALWRSKAAGIMTLGKEAGTVTDAAGDRHEVRFSLATSRLVNVKAVLEIDDEFPHDGESIIQSTLQEYSLGNRPDLGPGFSLNETIYASHLYCPIFSVPGVKNIRSVTLSTNGEENYEDRIDPPFDQVVEINIVKILRFG